MKKILSFALAGLAALSLMSCGLHDVELNPVDLTGYNIVGDFEESGWDNNKVVAFENAENEYEYTVKVTSTSDKMNFAFLPTAGTWAGQVGGDAMTSGDLPDGVSFEDTDNGNGGRNGTLSGLTKGSLYKITIDSSTGLFEISVVEDKEPAYFLLDGYFIRSLDASWNCVGAYLLYNPVKNASTGEVTYTVPFTASAATQQLAIARTDWGAGRYECSTAIEFAVDTASVDLEAGKEEHPVVTGLVAGRPYNAVITTTPDGKVVLSVETVKYIDVVGCKVVNYDGDKNTIYFLEAWIPGNAWNKTNPSGTVTEGTASVTFASTRLTSDSIALQMTDPSDPDGGFWDSKVGGGTKSVANPKDFKVYILVYDVETDELSLEESL